MKKIFFKYLLLVVSCVLSVFLSACGEKISQSSLSSASSVVQTITQVGQGQIKFTLSVLDEAKNETLFEINTDKEFLGEALLEHNLISGEIGQYGLFVTSVNNIKPSDKNKYWILYINGEYAKTGVDKTAVVAGNKYSFKIQ